MQHCCCQCRRLDVLVNNLGQVLKIGLYARLLAGCSVCKKCTSKQLVASSSVTVNRLLAACDSRDATSSLPRSVPSLSPSSGADQPVRKLVPPVLGADRESIQQGGERDRLLFVCQNEHPRLKRPLCTRSSPPRVSGAEWEQFTSPPAGRWGPTANPAGIIHRT